MKPLLTFIILLGFLSWPVGVEARSVVTPWSAETGVHNLVYGSSSPWDVQTALGHPPDQVIRTPQMYPLIENHYFFDEKGSGAATIFVFENGMLAGMHYKSPGNQWLDVTSFLPNNGDRRLQGPLLQGYQGYFPNFEMIYGMQDYE